MKSWRAPDRVNLPGAGKPPRIYDSARKELVLPALDQFSAGLYVCGITPYDATHLGHAFTYLAFDTLQRVWHDAGIDVTYVQNITDIDDPLLERAAATHTDWQELAAQQIELFRNDMSALEVFPPLKFIAVTETIPRISAAVEKLLSEGVAYEVPTTGNVSGQNDLYFDTRRAEMLTNWHLGDVSGLDDTEMHGLFRERGGDPERVGKRHPLDPCLWRAQRDGEPSWESPLGWGRPGWHIECSVIAEAYLGSAFTVQGGGHDLIFPHHEFSDAHAQALTGQPLAQSYMHAGLVAYQGEKMSKSRGNLVFVSDLLKNGHEPSALRLALLQRHYRYPWEWFDDHLEHATVQLDEWRALLSEDAARTKKITSERSSLGLLHDIRSHLAEDLDTPAAIAVFDSALREGIDDYDLAKQIAQQFFGVRI